MCLIVHKPAGVEFPVEILPSTISRNPDGVGVWTKHPDEEKARIYRSLMSPQVRTMVEKFTVSKNCTDREMVIHFRKNTKGATNKDNIHPFRLKIPEHWGRWWLMHNGTFKGVKTRADESDTSSFARQIVTMARRMKLKGDLVSDRMWDILYTLGITDGQRVILLDEEHIWFMAGTWDRGKEWKDCWFSNLYAWDAPQELKPKPVVHTPQGQGSYYDYIDHPYWNSGDNADFPHTSLMTKLRKHIGGYVKGFARPIPNQCDVCAASPLDVYYPRMIYPYRDSISGKEQWLCVSHYPMSVQLPTHIYDENREPLALTHHSEK